jgi:hypothetical protein
MASIGAPAIVFPSVVSASVGGSAVDADCIGDMHGKQPNGDHSHVFPPGVAPEAHKRYQSAPQPRQEQEQQQQHRQSAKQSATAAEGLEAGTRPQSATSTPGLPMTGVGGERR